MPATNGAPSLNDMTVFGSVFAKQPPDVRRFFNHHYKHLLTSFNPTLIGALNELGVTGMLITYSGSDDSGWVNEVRFTHQPIGESELQQFIQNPQLFPSDVQTNLPLRRQQKLGTSKYFPTLCPCVETMTNDFNRELPNSLSTLVDQFSSGILHWAVWVLGNSFPGWEIDDGSNGFFLVRTQSPIVQLHHNWNGTAEDSLNLLLAESPR